MTDISRRSFRSQLIKAIALASSALALIPYFVFGQAQPSIQMEQIAPSSINETNRQEIEKTVTIKEGKANYCQDAARSLGAPRNPAAKREILAFIHGINKEGHYVGSTLDKATVTWQTAHAGDEPIVRYDIFRDGKKVGEVARVQQQWIAHYDILRDGKKFSMDEPMQQQSADHFSFDDHEIIAMQAEEHKYRIVAIDAAGCTAQTGEIALADH